MWLWTQGEVGQGGEELGKHRGGGFSGRNKPPICHRVKDLDPLYSRRVLGCSVKQGMGLGVLGTPPEQRQDIQPETGRHGVAPVHGSLV